MFKKVKNLLKMNIQNAIVRVSKDKDVDTMLTKKEVYKSVRNLIAKANERLEISGTLVDLKLALKEIVEARHLLLPESEFPSNEANDLRKTIKKMSLEVCAKIDEKEEQQRAINAEGQVTISTGGELTVDVKTAVVSDDNEEGHEEAEEGNESVQPSATIETATTELHRAFDKMNTHFFEGKLPQCAITIQTKGKRLAYGWYTFGEIWQGEGFSMHEINISAESLNRPYMEVMKTLLHEMIHHYCFVNGIKDTSRGGTFHNKQFKKASEEHGFYYDEPADKKYGWTFSKLKNESMTAIENFGIDASNLAIGRNGEAGDGSEGKTANSFKWVCPNCEAKLRSTKREVNPVCGECSDFDNGNIVKFEMEE